MRKPNYRWILPVLGLITILFWFRAFPLKLPFDRTDVLLESTYLVTAIIGLFFITRLRIKVLDIGWGALTYSLLIDLLDEFTKEPDLFNTVLQGICEASGLLLVVLGLYLS